jgi:hypothetical protein
MTQSHSDPWIFLSYRRGSGTGWAARQLAATLETHCGNGMVFCDSRSIEASSSWDVTIERTLKSSHVLVALIDSSWRPERLADPDDWVRRELEWAMDHQLLLVPLVLDGAAMPEARDLPERIAAFSKVQAFFIEGRSEPVFQASMRVVAEHILNSVRTRIELVREPQPWWERIDTNSWCLYVDGALLLQLSQSETSGSVSVASGPHAIRTTWLEKERDTRYGQAYGPGRSSSGETSEKLVLRPGRHVFSLRFAPEIPVSRTFLQRIGSFLSAADETPRRIQAVYYPENL